MTRATALGFVAALMLLGTPALAQSSAEDRAAADVLYEESGNLMKAGRFSEACPRLETSQRLDPGVGTLLRLGYCYENVGRTASAWSAYNDAEGMARKTNDKRADEAAGRAKAVEPKLSKVIVVPQNAAGSNLEIRRDGTPLDAGLWGIAVPVDPGQHTIAASAARKRPWLMTITIQPKPGLTTVTIPQLEDAPPGPAVTVPTPDGTPGVAPFWRPQRVVGLALGVLGVVGFGIAAGFGVKAATKNTQSLAQCLPNDPNACPQSGVDLRNQAFSASYVSTGMAVAGGTLLAAGVVVFLTTPRGAPVSASASTAHARVQPVVAPGLGGLALRGEW